MKSVPDSGALARGVADSVASDDLDDYLGTRGCEVLEKKDFSKVLEPSVVEASSTEQATDRNLVFGTNEVADRPSL